VQLWLNVSNPDLPSSEKTGSDPLSRMRAYQLARGLLADSWTDAERLRYHPVTEKISGQLYAAVGSIAANIGEGYSRSSGRDRARIFEYALGSARESMSWYRSAEPVLGAELVCRRLDTLEEIRRLLLAVIPRERNRLIRPTKH
jgi:four helix bundle protein